MKVYGVINKDTRKLETRLAHRKASIASNRARRYMRKSGFKIPYGSKVLNIPDNTPLYSAHPESFLIPSELMGKRVLCRKQKNKGRNMTEAQLKRLEAAIEKVKDIQMDADNLAEENEGRTEGQQFREISCDAMNAADELSKLFTELKEA
jgi:hypothetical protein